MKQHGWKDKNILLPLSELSLASKQCWAAVRSSGKSLLFADHCSIWFFTEARTYKIKKGKKGMNEQILYSSCCDACMKDPHLHLILRSISGNVWKMWLDHPNHFMKYLHYTWNQHAVIAMQVLLWNTDISAWKQSETLPLKSHTKQIAYEKQTEVVMNIHVGVNRP